MGELIETIPLADDQEIEFGSNLKNITYIVQGLKKGEKQFSQYVIKI